jgi:Cof subfamily protein (haloacid dehalogenase superfamily)
MRDQLAANMPSEPRLFVSDVDRTLVNRHAELSARTRSELTRLLEAGLPFTVASARSHVSLRVMLAGLPLRLPVIEFNGAFLTDFVTGRRAFIRDIDRGVAEQVYALGETYGLVPFISTFDAAQERDRLFAGAPRNEGMRWYLDERRSFRDPRLEQVAAPSVGLAQRVVCMTFVAREALLAPLTEELTQLHAGRLQLHLFENPYSPGWHWLTIQDVRATKALALQTLCESLSVPLQNLTVFGDERNDIPMFRIAGRAVAVGNAHADVKDCAHTVIGDYETDSVVEYLASAAEL